MCSRQFPNYGFFCRFSHELPFPLKPPGASNLIAIAFSPFAKANEKKIADKLLYTGSVSHAFRVVSPVPCSQLRHAPHWKILPTVWILVIERYNHIRKILYIRSVVQLLGCLIVQLSRYLVVQLVSCLVSWLLSCSVSQLSSCSMV